MKKFLIMVALLFSVFLVCGFATDRDEEDRADWAQTELTAKEELKIWKRCYPDVKFNLTWDAEVNDWKLTVVNYDKSYDFYWCNGKYLPKEQLNNQEKFWRVISHYQNKILDPAEFTPEMLERIRSFGSNRKTGAVSSKFIFNAIYDSQTRLATEQHIQQITFLGKKSNVHSYIIPALRRVETRIYRAARTNDEVKDFIDTLYSAGAYNWREIRDVNTKSFHSFGIAIDLLPDNWGQKIVYWDYEKGNGNEDWMLIPLSERWMPPKAVVDIFYDEGFIWGGNWAVWDNMHFEYHPELVAASKK